MISKEFEEEIDSTLREGHLLSFAYHEYRAKREDQIRQYFAECDSLEQTSERFKSSHSYIAKVLGKAYLDSIQPEPEEQEVPPVFHV